MLDFRLDLAKRFCADEVFDSSKGAFADFVRNRYPQGVAIALDTASSNLTVRLAIDLLQYGGHLILNGYYPPSESQLDWHWLRTKEITFYCPNSRTRQRLEVTLELIGQGVVKVKELVTHEFPVSQASEAYAKLLASEPDFLGMVINWQKE